MKTYINGLQDMNTIIRNERRLGGAVEAEWIRLRSGEEFLSPVITGIDTYESMIYSIGIFTNEGKRLIVSVSEIARISEPCHKRLCDLSNKEYKSFKITEKVKYLLRLCELNEGSCTSVFQEEVERITQDIGDEAIQQLSGRHPILQKVPKIVQIRIA